MSERPVVVVGGGAMGAATAWWLARSGHPVTLLEQYAPGHTHGSSHGSSRIFRFSYDDERYVDLGVQAQALWRTLEGESGAELITQVGCVDHGPPEAIEPIRAALVARGVPNHVMPPDEATDRWPTLRFDESVLFEPEAGRANAEATVASLHSEAARLGADVRVGCAARDVRVTDSGVEVVTDQGVIKGSVVVLAAGGWLPGLLARGGNKWTESAPSLATLPRLRVTQEQPAYFVGNGDGEGQAVGDLPSFVHLRDFNDARVSRPIAYYGLFTPGHGVKVGEHGTGPQVAPDDRVDLDPAGVLRLENYVADWLPGLAPRAVEVDSCLYTSTPDEEFLVERHGWVVVCSPCSGHGFKFVPALGRRTAELALGSRKTLWP